MNQKVTEEHLRRRAIVYVRQSTPIQLVQNRESQLRQYGLSEHARKLGFRDVETIDADLGRSGSGLEEDGRIDLNPDRRVQQAIRHIFDKLAELNSVHQVFLSFREDGILVPFARFDRPGETVEWNPPRYRSLHAVLGNPVYAGAYVYGKSESRTVIVDGQARRTANNPKLREQWSIVILDHHPGYIS